MNWIATSVFPPTAKKLSWMQIFSNLKTLCDTFTRNFSSTVRGATYSSVLSGGPPSGEGSAFRSTFPIAVRGRIPLTDTPNEQHMKDDLAVLAQFELSTNDVQKIESVAG